MKKVGKIILIILGILVVILLIAFIILWINSPGKLRVLKDDNGDAIPNSITEKNYLTIGGIEQGFFLRGENPENPVILYLHGGPGSPELPLIEASEPTERLEKYFTICYWDQRGAGMTYSNDTPPESMSVSQFVEDTREMTEYLIERFGQRKIYLMGHSWGSYLGVKTIEKYPQYYYAYMGIGQVTDQLSSEQMAHKYMLHIAQETGDKKGVKQLGKFDPDAPGFPTKEYMLTTRTPYMNKYGIGITHKQFSMVSLLMDVMMFKGYTVSDKIGYAKGSLFSFDNAFYHVIDDKLSETSTEFRVPVYVIHGLYDYQVSCTLANRWMKIIHAPAKKIYIFENSAHSPNMEEPEKFVSTVREIAARHNSETSVIMEVIPNRFDTIPEKITYRIENYTDDNIEFGAGFEMDFYQDGQWVKMPFTDQLAVIQVLYGLLSGGSDEFNAYLYPNQFHFEPGNYRLRKTVSTDEGKTEISAEFSIE